MKNSVLQFTVKYVIPSGVALFFQLAMAPLISLSIETSAAMQDLGPRITAGELGQQLLSFVGLGATVLALSFPISIPVIWLVIRFWLKRIYGMPHGARNWWIKQGILLLPVVVWTCIPLLIPGLWIVNYGTVPSVAGFIAIPILALVDAVVRIRMALNSNPQRSEVELPTT